MQVIAITEPCLLGRALQAAALPRAAGMCYLDLLHKRRIGDGPAEPTHLRRECAANLQR